MGPGVPAYQIDRAAGHVPPGGGDNGVGLGMDAAAQLVPLAPGDLHGLPGAVAQVRAVGPAPGGAIIAGGDDLVVFNDDGAVEPAQAGGPLQNGLGDVEIIVFLADPLHGSSSGPFF